MLWGIPPDLAVFAVVVLAFFAIGLPLITGRIAIPRRIEFEVLADHQLTPDQTDYFARLDAKLLEMGYRPVGLRQTLNMQGRALIRIYMSDGDPAIVMMNLLTSEVSGGGEHPMNYLEIVTRYGDGTVLSTRNAEISDVLDRPPDHLVLEMQGCREPSRLKKAHDAKASELLVRDPRYLRAEDFERVFNEFHEKWCLHQLEHGLLVEKDGEPEQLRPTIKTGLRGIANFLNPLADNFTVPRFLAACVVGIVVPVMTVLWLDGPGRVVLARIASLTGFSQQTAMTALLTVLLTAAGVLIGWLFVGKAFVWAFLVTYIVLRLMGPQSIWAALALSLWVGAVANWAAARREKPQHLA
jgi:hypothetical protein